MKRLMLSVAMMIGFATAAAAADPVEGTWKTEPGDAGGWLYVTVAPCGDAICGTIATGYTKKGDPDPTYEYNGKKMIWDMQADGNGYYSGGKIWDPDSGKTYKSKMTLRGDTLAVEGCILFICRDGGTWRRVK